MQDLITFIKDLIPTPNEAIAGGGAAIGGGLLGIYGWSGPAEALIVCMILDYWTGILAAYVHPDKKLSSATGFRGICKKIIILCIIGTTYKVAVVTGQEFINTMTVWYFLANEALSVLENAANAGIPLPQKLIDSLEQVKGGKKNG